MEHKIGEIFELGGEWYQCIIGHCNQCSFDEAGTCKFIGNPYCAYRNDKILACFKKLEKVGEPYIIGNKLIQRYKIYPTTYHINVYGWYYHNLDVKSWTIDIEIKQNKEDMEENNDIRPYDELFSPGTVSNTKHLAKEDMEEKKIKLDKLVTDYTSNKITYNEFEKAVKELYADKEESKPSLKSFSLEAAKQGKPVCTRDGRRARIICFDCKDETFQIVALVSGSLGKEEIISYDKAGYSTTRDHDEMLMMLPEKKEGWINVYKERIYSTKEEAIEATYDGVTYIDTIKISWEE